MEESEARYNLSRDPTKSATERDQLSSRGDRNASVGSENEVWFDRICAGASVTIGIGGRGFERVGIGGGVGEEEVRRH